MAAVTVNTTVATLVTADSGMRAVLVQNGGAGGLWVDTAPGPNATVTTSTGVYIAPGATVPVDVYQTRLVAVSNSSCDVRYC